LVIVSLLVSTSAGDCLEGLVSGMTCYVLSATFNSIYYSHTHSVFIVGGFCTGQFFLGHQ